MSRRLCLPPEPERAELAQRAGILVAVLGEIARAIAETYGPSAARRTRRSRLRALRIVATLRGEAQRIDRLPVPARREERLAHPGWLSRAEHTILAGAHAAALGLISPPEHLDGVLREHLAARLGPAMGCAVMDSVLATERQIHASCRELDKRYCAEHGRTRSPYLDVLDGGTMPPPPPMGDTRPQLVVLRGGLS